MPVIVAVGEAIVEVMRTQRDQPLDRPGDLSGPYPSGAPAIFASTAARLGSSVGLVGTVGDDAFGTCVESRLLADGVDVTALRRTSERLTGIAFVAYRADGDRSFVFHLPQSAAADVRIDQVPDGYLDDTRYLHIMGSSLSIGEPMRRACYVLAQRVHARGGFVSLDPNLRPELMPVSEIRAVCEPILDLTSIVFPSGDELTTLTGKSTVEEGAAALLGRGVQLVALKRGELGSTLFTPEGATLVPPLQVDEVDPTGAGDAYDAAFIVGLSKGWTLEATGLMANACGALATTRLGPMEGSYSQREVLSFMASQGRPLPPLTSSAGSR